MYATVTKKFIVWEILFETFRLKGITMISGQTFQVTLEPPI